MQLRIAVGTQDAIECVECGEQGGQRESNGETLNTLHPCTLHPAPYILNTLHHTPSVCHRDTSFCLLFLGHHMNVVSDKICSLPRNVFSSVRSATHESGLRLCAHKCVTNCASTREQPPPPTHTSRINDVLQGILKEHFMRCRIPPCLPPC